MPALDKEQLRQLLRQRLAQQLQSQQSQAKAYPMIRSELVNNQNDRSQLARDASLISGMSQAGAKIGGSQAGSYLPREAERLQGLATAGEATLERPKSTIDYKILDYLGKADKEDKKDADKDNLNLKKLKLITDPYSSEMKPITARAAAFSQLENLLDQAKDSQNRKGAVDGAIIKSFEKMLDPGSVVRDHEAEAVRKFGGVMDSARVKVAGLLTGQQLSDDVRDQIRETVRSVYKAAVAAKAEIDDRYRARGESAGFGPKYNFDKHVSIKIPELPGSGSKVRFQELSRIRDGKTEYFTPENETELKEAQAEGFK